MEEFNLLPIYRNGFGEISDGIDVPVPTFCKRKCQSSEKCKQHYIRMENAAPGMYQCPYGFVSYVFQIEEDNYVFTCLRVEGEYDKSKISLKVKGESKRYREITKEMLTNYADAYKEFHLKQNQYEVYKRFIEDIFHDVRKFNKDIKIKNDRIYRKAQQSRKFAEILEASKSIQAMGWFLSVRLNNHDFIYNKQLMEVDMKTTYNIYKIIDKVRKCMEERAKAKSVVVKLNANRDCCKDMQAYDCIELLPYLLLDNAIKYSPEGETVHIHINEQYDRQHVQISSLGPMASQTEESKLKKQGYRGDNAKALTNIGMGIGLYTADCICNLNGIELQVKSGKELKLEKKGIKFSEFVVDFWIEL